MTQTESRVSPVLRVVVFAELLSLKNRNAQEDKLKQKVSRGTFLPLHTHLRRPTQGSKNHLIIDFMGALRETLLANILSQSLDGVFILYISKLLTMIYLP